MKHRFGFLLWSIALMILLCTEAAAMEIAAEQADMINPQAVEDALPEDAADLLGDVTASAPGDFSVGLYRLGEAGIRAVRTAMPEALRTVGILTLIAVLGAALQAAGLETSKVLNMAVALAMLLASTEGIQAAFQIGRQTLDELETFSVALLASLSAGVAATGAVTSASTLYAGSSFFLHILLRLILEFLLPLVYGFLATTAASAAFGTDLMRRVGDLLRWFITICLKVLTTAFVVYLSISGVISGSADASAIKAVKLAFSTAVPVVGSIISDASETVLVSAGVLKNTVGVFGVLGALAICLIPFIRIGLEYLALKVAAALCAVLDSGGAAKLADHLATAMGLILAMTSVALLITVFSAICAMRLVTV